MNTFTLVKSTATPVRRDDAEVQVITDYQNDATLLSVRAGSLAKIIVHLTDDERRHLARDLTYGL